MQRFWFARAVRSKHQNIIPECRNLEMTRHSLYRIRLTKDIWTFERRYDFRFSRSSVIFYSQDSAFLGAQLDSTLCGAQGSGKPGRLLLRLVREGNRQWH
jgi:hypothetical protein